jgi:hypothetical protein
MLELLYLLLCPVIFLFDRFGRHIHQTEAELMMFP